jgi:hypothetical protein
MALKAQKAALRFGADDARLGELWWLLWLFRQQGLYHVGFEQM